MVGRALALVNTHPYGCGMSERQRLSKTDWILAGFRALCARGPVALRAESLARELGVSKGSFYWHFADISSFQVAMIDYWVSVATQGIIETVESEATSAQARLQALVHLATEPPPAVVGGPGAEGAIRCWGRADSTVGARLREVDAARIAYCTQLFKAHGQAPARAALHGRLLYAALIGLEQLDQAGLAKSRDDLLEVLQQLL